MCVLIASPRFKSNRGLFYNSCASLFNVIHLAQNDQTIIASQIKWEHFLHCVHCLYIYIYTILSTFILRWNKKRQEWIVEKVWNARKSNGMEWNDVTLLRSPMWSFLACTYVFPDMTGSRCVIMAIVRKLHLKKKKQITCNIFYAIRHHQQ